MDNAGADTGISTWLTMTIPTGKCMQLVAVLIPQLTAKETDTLPP